ncbi:hypothetical protein ATANTOWER_022286 [Ataeniobius toweri]|uniref:Uncharacterized protein n=1 Tax=Ataeniobius toweri TaxID=208326 RepID=A0ABU7B0X8_9TELE|nr:hypothetical protein [Ataeniobius toweri]
MTKRTKITAATQSCVISSLQVRSTGTSQGSSAHHSNPLLLSPSITLSELSVRRVGYDVAEGEVPGLHELTLDQRVCGGVSEGGFDQGTVERLSALAVASLGRGRHHQDAQQQTFLWVNTIS